MQYKVITSTNKNEFESKVNESLDLGWQLQGSHQLMQSFGLGSNGSFYSQTMVRNVLHLKDEVIQLLNSIKTDAEMALDGRWDCTTTEGMESGFEAQIFLIDKVLDKLK